jgi:hypothetical protein
MQRKLLFIILMLTTSVTQASVFKCKTPAGIIYSERPCPANSTEISIRANSLPNQEPSLLSDINNVNAVPLPVPEKQRGAYLSFLTRHNPRAFVICTDGRVMSFNGNSKFIDQKLSSLPGGCAPYAINDAVVWSGK